MSKVHTNALVSRGVRSPKAKHPVMLFGRDLGDVREEMFLVMVCDGLPMGLAFKRAGFSSKDHNAPSRLFALPRVQERAAAILEARRSTGVVSLGEVTDMLKRVYAGANSAEEYSAAHNAAFSLARLYGHVTDRATLEVIRRPSRDPDAPSEQALSSWVESLPVIGSSSADQPQIGAGQQAQQGQISALQGPPAQLLGPEVSGPAMQPADAALVNTPSADRAELSNDINADLRIANPEIDWHGLADGWVETGNGAPARPVTGTPTARGRSDLLGRSAPSEKTGPLSEQTGTSYPSAEELFG
jgi:hypothetical protein